MKVEIRNLEDDPVSRLEGVGRIGLSGVKVLSVWPDENGVLIRVEGLYEIKADGLGRLPGTYVSVNSTGGRIRCNTR